MTNLDFMSLYPFPPLSTILFQHCQHVALLGGCWSTHNACPGPCPLLSPPEMALALFKYITMVPTHHHPLSKMRGCPEPHFNAATSSLFSPDKRRRAPKPCSDITELMGTMYTRIVPTRVPLEKPSSALTDF